MSRTGHRKWRSRARKWLLESSPATSWGISLTALVVLALLDYASPRYITFGTFYLVLIAYASWVLDRRSGWLVALLAMGASIGINGFGIFVSIASDTSRDAAIGWNILMRLLSSALVIELVRSFRNSFNYERRLGTTDPLTGILNRRAFLDTVSARLPRVGSRGRTAIVAYLDLDGFKPVNDRHGHAAGDEVLVHFADVLAGAVRRYDCAGRSGGDEFLLFLDVPNEKSGERVMLRLHREIEAQLEKLPYGKLSCSMGAVIVPPSHPLPAIDTLISQADSLMYQAKAHGLTRLRIAPSWSLPSSRAGAHGAHPSGDRAGLTGAVPRLPRRPHGPTGVRPLRSSCGASRHRCAAGQPRSRGGHGRRVRGRTKAEGSRRPHCSHRPRFPADPGNAGRRSD